MHGLLEDFIPLGADSGYAIMGAHWPCSKKLEEFIHMCQNIIKHQIFLTGTAV